MNPRLRAILMLTAGGVAYYFLSHIPLGGTILYPFQLLVTILHEFGHAAGALITGGDVMSVQINPDGSGVTWSSGGSRFVTIAGGYIGSAVFGNLLLYMGIRHPSSSNYVMYGLFIVTLAISTIWSPSIANTLLVAIYALVFWFIGEKLHHEVSSWVLSFMGILSVLFVLQDFRVGPSSDLAQFTALIPILPYTAWMFIWLGIAGLITWWNVKNLLRG